MNDYASLTREQLIARLSALESRMADAARDMPDCRRSEQEYRTIIQASMDSFWKLAPDGRILDCNEAACAMLGYSRDELLGLSPHDMERLEDEGQVNGHIRLIITQGHDRFETQHRRKDGSIIDVEVSAYHVPGAEGGLLFAFTRDVTTSKAALKALHESEERYRAVVEDQTELISRFLPDGTVLFANEVYCRRLGKRAKELVGSRWHPVAHHENLPMIDARLRELAPDNPVVVIENRIRDADGQLRWMQFVNRAFFDHAGKITEIQAVGRDITDRKRVESKLQAAQAFKQAILDAVTTQVAVLDKEGIIVEVNEAWRRFALENAPVPGQFLTTVGVGTNYLDICRSASGYSAEGAQEAALGIQAVLDGRIPKYEQECQCHSPQAKRWFLMTVTPLCQEQGGVVISHQDISAPRRLAEELRQSEACIRSILRTAPVGIGVLVDRVFLEVNDAFVSMTGYAAEELIGRSARIIYPTDEDFEYVGREKYRQIGESGIGQVETRFLTKDGRIIDVGLSSAPVMPEDLSRGVTFTAQDITAIKRAEQERLAREARQRVALVREVHHRIKNHLQGVLGLMHNAITEHPELAGAMENLVTRVRAITQVYGLQDSCPDVQVRACDLMQIVVNDAVSAVPIEYRRLSKDMEAVLWPDEAVPMALIVNELITNAIKHLGTPDVNRPIQVSSKIENGKVSIVVKNAPASLPAGFDLASGKGAGTGLELLKALLPPKGATLGYRQEGDAVIAELVLEPPVVTCHTVC